MKICYIADASSIHTQRWIRYFADRGHEIHLISQNPLKSNIHGVTLHRLKILRVRMAVNRIINLMQVMRLLKRIRPDVLHAHFITYYGTLGALTGYHPFVVTAWGSDILIMPRKYRWNERVVKYVLKRSDIITCDGENIKEAMIRLGLEPEKIAIISHGVDTRRFRPIPKDGGLCNELGISNSPVIISIRHLDPIYNVETLINSVPLVLKQVPEAKFLIVGRGVQEGYLKELARSLKILGSVRFVGEVSHDEVPRYLSLADIYVSTSLSDGGVSVSLMEAMACGLPPIVTDVGDNRKWIKDGENGFIIPTRDPESLAEKIIYLLGNGELRNKMGKINRQLIGERASYWKEMERMERLYERLVGEGR